MCFRPSSVDSSVICPECGKKVSAMGGVPLTKCLFCGADLSNARAATAEDNQEAKPLGNDVMPAAPSAPKAPSAPSAPKPPQG